MSLSVLAEYGERYRQFVVSQPLVLSEVESGLRWLSYLAAGDAFLVLVTSATHVCPFSAASKYNTTHILSEFLYSSSNLLQLLNDSLLRRSASVKIDVPAAVEHLQTLLQVLEYTSVLAEFGANAFASKFGRWILIGCFQVAKAVIKLLLLLKFKQGLQLTNPVLPLDRRVDLISLYNNKADSSKAANSQNHETSATTSASAEAQAECSEMGSGDSVVTLKRSGRVMRTLDQAPARDQRTWLLPNGDTRFRQLLQRTRKDAPPSPLTDHQTLGEVLHILKPVAHLGSMAVFGSVAWTPFFVSLGMDLTSLKLLHEPHDKMWNMSESIELGQRSFALLLYVLRSPLYDRYTKEKIVRVLSTMSNRIPLIGRLISPMVSYLPEWQKTYFYVWGS